MNSLLNTHFTLISDSEHNPALEMLLPDGRGNLLSLIQSSLPPDILPARYPVILGPH